MQPNNWQSSQETEETPESSETLGNKHGHGEVGGAERSQGSHPLGKGVLWWLSLGEWGPKRVKSLAWYQSESVVFGLAFILGVCKYLVHECKSYSLFLVLTFIKGS